MKKKFLISIAVSVGVLILTALISNIPFFRHLELKTLDYRFSLRKETNIDNRLVLVGIDDYDIKMLGHWPWPRTYHAVLLETLAMFHAKITGFDILFADPDENESDGDRQFVSALRLLPDVCLAAYLRFQDAVMRHAEKEMDMQRYSLPSVDISMLELSQSYDVRLPFFSAREAAHIGFINAPKDRDGVIRNVPLVLEYRGLVFPSFSLRILMDFFDVENKNVRFERGAGLILEQGTFRKIVPMDRRGFLLINYRGKCNDFNHITYRQVLKAFRESSKGGTVSAFFQKLSGSIVLVGLTATGITDTGATSLGTNSPMILVHLNALNSMLQDDYLHVPGFLPALLMLLVIIFITAVFSLWLRPVYSAVCSVVLLGGYISLSLVLFMKASLWMPWISVITGAVLTLGTIIFYRFMQEEREKLKIKRAFGNYLSHNVLENVLKDKDALTLGGARRDMSVLFLDIMNFTGFCERHTPEEIVCRLNECFSGLTEIVFRYDGTFDKFVGDELVAFWGAPEEQDDHALRAVRAALDMVRKIRELQSQWQETEQEVITIGIGINSGEMLVGNMGSDRIMDYTVIGDEVNLAARLEGLTRKYDTPIVISEQTYMRIKAEIQADYLEEVTVKGRKKPVKIYSMNRS